MHTQNQCSRFRCRLYSTAPLICSRSTRSRPPVVLFGPLHTFTNDSKCHLPPNAPAPDAPAHLRARTHTRAHTCPHTPSPRLRPGGGLGPGEPARPPPGGWRRAPRPHRRCHRDAEPRVLSANSSAPPGFPKPRRPRRLPLRGEAPARRTARGSPAARA